MTENKIIEKIFSTEEAMHAFASEFAAVIKPGACIYLSGELGVGKTTFTRGLLQAMGITGRIKSPTYTLVEPYEVHHKKIFHFDLYRLEDPNELLNIGIHEYFAPEYICLIEWPEKGAPVLPAPDLILDFNFLEVGRSLKVKAVSVKGEGYLSRL